MELEARQIYKNYGSHRVLQGVDMRVEAGALHAILGPSGCGKTTLLRLFAGLEAPDSGTISWGGQAAHDPGRVGFVFQHYALFRHMTVADNVAFGLRARPRDLRPASEDIRRRVHDILALVQLEHLEDRLPHQLSGGQRQRVALARSLVVEPRVLLLDEPFGALDAQVRKDLRRWLRGLQERLGITTVLVTHDQEEAMEVADRVLVLNQGRVEQEGRPEELYQRPATPFVYRFLGDATVFHRWKTGVEGVETLWARPHDVEVRREPFGGAWAGTVRRVFFAGGARRIEIQGSDGGLEAPDARDMVYQAEVDPEAGDWVAGERVWFAPRRTQVFQDAGAGI